MERFSINPEVVKTLARQGITKPSPIQLQAIPLALQGKDVIGIAQTGTGKTLAFGIPLIEHVARTKERALVLAPTRELAVQIRDSLNSITEHTSNRLQSVVIIGGVPADRQIRELKRNPAIIIATPGRLNDLLKRRVLTIANVGFLVLDEADRLFDMGFAPQVNTIVSQITAKHQTLLFSATMPPAVLDLTKRCQTNPVRVEVAPSGSTVEQIDHKLCFVPNDNKAELLDRFLKNGQTSTLVFTRTKRGANKLGRRLAVSGHKVAEIHANKSFSQRGRALANFKAGRINVLVATDIAARGIDVPDIGLVVNYDLPDAAEDYVHRIGRTGRAGKAGRAVTFATLDQVREVAQIERLIKQDLALVEQSLPRPSFTPAQRSNARSFSSRRPFRRQWQGARTRKF